MRHRQCLAFRRQHLSEGNNSKESGANWQRYVSNVPAGGTSGTTPTADALHATGKYIRVTGTLALIGAAANATFLIGNGAKHGWSGSHTVGISTSVFTLGFSIWRIAVARKLESVP